jgi:subtilisin family serine protease
MKTPLELINLAALMERTCGKSEIVIGLIDGPIQVSHPDLAHAVIREIPGELSGTCSRAESAACMHGTFVAGMLCARRESTAPGICPACTLLLRPIFAESTSENRSMPSATPKELAAAIIDCVDGGARVINLSAALAQPSGNSEWELKDAMDYAARRGVIVVAAAGNQGAIGSSAITRHPWVIPVVACDLTGRPLSDSNLASSIGRRGLSAPGENITSLAADHKTTTAGGTSVASPFVTGAIALLWSEFPKVTAANVKTAVAPNVAPGRAAIVPPLLNVRAAHQNLMSLAGGRRGHE